MWHCRAKREIGEHYPIYVENRGIAYLDDSIRDLGTRDDGVCAHHSVGILFSDLRDQKGTHTSTSSTTKRVGDLET